MDNIYTYDNGEKFVQQYPENILDENERQLEINATCVTFLLAVAALNPEFSAEEYAEVLNKLSKNAKNGSVVIDNKEYIFLLFDKGKSLVLSVRAKDSKQ